jgi:hypothetical protein
VALIGNTVTNTGTVTLTAGSGASNGSLIIISD